LHKTDLIFTISRNNNATSNFIQIQSPRNSNLTGSSISTWRT